MRKVKLRQCAVCSDRSQVNVTQRWVRTCDGQEFNVCLNCRELGKVNSYAVHEVVTRTYTTVARRGR